MYIAPNSKIILLKNCPLDTTYDHTIYFYDTTGQYNYFYGLRKYSFTEQTYQRLNRGVLRIARVADDLYDCNYLMFQNSSYGNKWFYAFINKVEYINNSVSEITYQIDVMQTWYFDYTLDRCFVEREHSLTDNVGENLVPENIGLGEYVYRPVGLFQQYFAPGISNYYIIIACSETFNTQTNTWVPATGSMYCGVYSGVQYLWFDNVNDANTWVAKFTQDNKADSIIAIFMMPRAFFQTVDGVIQVPVNAPASVSGTISRINSFADGTGDSYTPRNNKLLTYPYNCISCISSEGDEHDYKWEFLNSGQSGFTFSLFGTVNTVPEFMIIPQQYNSATFDFSNSMYIGSSPQCAYTIDSYRAWVAQRKYTLKNEFGRELMQTVGGAFYGVASGGDFRQGFRGLQAQKATLAEMEQAKTLPASTRSRNTDVMALGVGWFGFNFYRKQIRPQFARIIDDYFDRYGYATNRNKIPNRYARENWTYTKTQSCTITGSVPADDAKAICAIYDNGITFWANGNNVGNYSLSNRPMGS